MIEERTGRALNHLRRIDQINEGRERLKHLYKLYHALRELVSVKKRNFTPTLQKRLIIPLLEDGNVNKEDREVELVHRFGLEEQRSPLRSALCIRFLEDLIRVMRTSEERQYGEKDAEHLTRNNMEGRLAKEVRGLTYEQIANTLIQRYVHIDPTATLREVIAARKPFGQTWGEYIEYITSMVEQIVPISKHQKKTQNQLARMIILTQLDNLSRGLVADTERKSSKFSVEHLGEYLDSKTLKKIQMGATGGMKEETPTFAIPLITTRRKGAGWGRTERLKLMTNDYQWIGRKVKITRFYLEDYEQLEITDVEVSKGFTCEVPMEEFSMPNSGYEYPNHVSNQEVSVGTIVAHAVKMTDMKETIEILATTSFGCEACELVGHSAKEPACPYFDMEDKTTCSRCKTGKHREETCKGLKVNDLPTPGVFMNLPEIRRVERSESIDSENLPLSDTSLSSHEELVERMKEIPGEREQMMEGFRINLIRQLETRDMSDQARRRLRRRIGIVVSGKEYLVSKFMSALNTLMSDQLLHELEKYAEQL